MVPNYRTISISAEANENVVPKIYELLKAEGYTTPIFVLDFVGFEAAEGTSFKINNNPLKVPSTGRFYSPFRASNDFLKISSLTFDEAISNMNLWIIY